MGDDDALRATLRESQRLGFLGARPIEDVLAHARVFVRALDGGASRAGSTIVDLGSGGGVPGLVIAHDLADVRLTLVDRRTKRSDFLERVVRRHGWSERVRVLGVDAQVLASDEAHTFDAVVARGFGPPAATLELAARLVEVGGRIVLSEPPSGDRWDGSALVRLGLTREELVDPAGRVVIFHRH